ncbi:hypothetical protein SESBI_13923 [Sesbania bispinosa]|nr:hypothetical protein SESBI_13923 [Sesbania bispinosa]
MFSLTIFIHIFILNIHTFSLTEICVAVLLPRDGEDDWTATADGDLQAADNDLQGGEMELEAEK